MAYQRRMKTCGIYLARRRRAKENGVNGASYQWLVFIVFLVKGGVSICSRGVFAGGRRRRRGNGAEEMTVNKRYAA